MVIPSRISSKIVDTKASVNDLCTYNQASPRGSGESIAYISLESAESDRYVPLKRVRRPYPGRVARRCNR
jgi:hypothetical protein